MPSLSSLFNLISKQPELLAEHARAYGELAAVESGLLVAVWQRRIVLQVMAAFGATLGLILAGVAAMLWAVLPLDAMRWPWALLLVPALPLGLGLYGWLAGRSTPKPAAFAALRGQFQADLAVLRESNPP